MIGGELVLGLIPARGGSKRLANKNLSTVGGRTLVALAVECAKAVPEIDIVAVSTNVSDIALEAFQCGALVIPRPGDLALDDSTTEDAVAHARALLSAPWVVVLQPTSPLRTPQMVSSLLNHPELLRHGRGWTSSVGRKPDGVAYAQNWTHRAESLSGGRAGAVLMIQPCIDIDTVEDLLEARRIYEGED